MTTPAEGQAPTTSEGQAPTPPPEGTPPTTPGAGQQPASGIQTLDEANTVIGELRREAAASRKARQDAEAALKAKEDAELTEQQRIAKERDEAKAELDQVRTQAKTQAIRSAVIAEAAKAGSIDPEAVAMFIGALEVDESGTPLGVTEAVAKVLTDRPYLAAGTPPPPAVPALGATNPAKGRTDGQLTREDLVGMTPQQIDTAREEGRLNDLLSGKA